MTAPIRPSYAPPLANRRWRVAAFVLLAATVAQLAAGALLDLDQFAGKAFGARLLAYPAMMLALPVGWWLATRSRPGAWAIPWDATALVMWGFFVDVTGNTLDLYDSITWWDDSNHFANWVTLSLGAGICLAHARPRPRWILGLVTAGLGAILAIAWELGEWYTFIRHGTELATAYEDTLGDEVLGTLGAAVAGVLVVLVDRRRSSG
jgi:hypothetical protein